MKKLLALVLALVLCLSLFAGCSADVAPAPESEKPVVDAGDDAAEAVEITWWAFPTFAPVDGEAGKYEQSLADQYMAENEGVTVKVEMLDFANGPDKIVTAVQGGTAPDVLFDAPGRIIDYGMSGYLAPLDDMIEALKPDVTSDAILSACADVDGNYWMYPSSSAPFIMAVNKTALETAGLFDQVPQDGSRTWTTEEFVALSKDMVKAGFNGMEVYAGGPGGDQGTRASMANLTGATITTPDLSSYNMSSEEGKAAFNMVMDGVNEGWLTGNTAGQAGDALEHFATPGGATFWAVNLWNANVGAARAGELEAAGQEAFAVCLPSKSGTPDLEYLVNGFAIFDTEDEARIAASKDFVSWLCDDEVVGKANVVATNCFPVRTSFGDLYGGDEEMAFYASLSEFYGTYYNTVPGFAAMRPFWWGSLQAMLTEDMTPDEAAQYFDDMSNPTLVK